MVNYAAARQNMVECQLRTNKVTDAGLLDAFGSVPRELFVPAPLRGIAYVDEHIALDNGRFVMAPMILARMLQAARPEPDEIALDLGCATGYTTAVLSRLAATVVALEGDTGLAGEANRTLSELEIDNAVVVEGPLTAGYPRQAPYNVIVVGGAVAEIPPAISGQLADGGRLVAVVKESASVGRAILVRRRGGVTANRILFDAAAPLLPGFEAEPGFAF